ncbi:ABC transporter ATP-binding protein [Herbiconiux sp. CPCC 203407]|uniref:ABC transporter ATP-binding protein n=1 Tax=Herbiconiux oxytropis TaxID=2970915 RepID=A0AA41XEZ3_9MICO|nr:ABC transporter ATP-binding protein [Herbiconiux oxytropis]MCS5724083.1 ABC transporter ATP-binding protein [Herbiconiux oxytropis]MCS5726984.1 ABC transporter ATP-binding protein [Herbiconiux oxytropis]
MPLFQLDAFSVSFADPGLPQRHRFALDTVHELSYSVEPGETVAIVGESGSGKSVSLLAATGLLDGDIRTRGRVLFRDHDLLSLPQASRRRILGKEIGFVFQDPQSNLHPFMTIGAQIEEVLTEHTSLNRTARRRRVLELLGEVGIPRPEEKAQHHPGHLSGGQRQRVMIAMAIALNPALIIADEPTTALDVSVQAGILDLLTRLQAEHGTAIVFVSHDLAVVSRIADRVVVLKGGRLVETGTRDELYENPREQYTRDLLEASRARIRPRAARDGIRIGPPLLEVTGLTKHYRRGRRTTTAIEGLDFTVGEGEIVGVVGESGSGKSTVGTIVAGLQTADAGSITLAGHPYPVGGRHRAGTTAPHLAPELRRSVQLVFQDPFASLNPRRTVFQSIAAPLEAHGWSRAAVRERVAEVARRTVVDEVLLERYPVALSGGQKQRIAIARALALGPRLVVADEPLAALDVTTQVEIIELILSLQQTLGTAFLFISHDLGVVASIAQRVIVLGPDGVAEIGRTEQVFTEPRSEYTGSLLAAIPRLDDSPAEASR